MILAAGITPTWQQIYSFDRFSVGEVNRASNTARCASGKVLNVGIALNQLRAESRVLSMVGQSDRDDMDRELAALGTAVRWIEIMAPTRTCTSILDHESGTITELVEKAGLVSEDELAQFRAAFLEEAGGADFVVLTGSLPAGAALSFHRDLLENVHCPVLLDTRGEELLLALEQEPLAVKPNREELAATFGKSLTGEEDLHSAMAELNHRGAQWVVVSEGGRAVWVRGGGQLYRLDPPQLARVVNPIGCGDVLAAGIATALVRGDDLLEAARFGMTAASESALNLLPARFDASRIADAVRRG
jgi:1-phosphofructokinase family hexose kinase